jgi:GT2 family glycosyltransferase
MTPEMKAEAPPSDQADRAGSLPHVCFIVVTYNAEQFVGHCLASLLGQSYPAEKIQVMVVDNASTDSTVRIVTQRFPDITLIVSPRNLGFARANNVAIRRTDTDFVALVNADAVLEPTWLERMVEGMASDPAIAIGGCKIYYPDGLLQHVGGIIHGNGLTDHQGAFEPDAGQYNERRDVDYVTGAAMIVRREALNELGALPEEYFLYYEEVELCVRARKAGYRVVCFPDAVATHHEAYGSGRLSSKFLLRYHRSRLRFIDRNYTCQQFFHQFLPSEREWIRQYHPPKQVLLLLSAYLVNFRHLAPYLTRCFLRRGRP